MRRCLLRCGCNHWVHIGCDGNPRPRIRHDDGDKQTLVNLWINQGHLL